MSYRITLIPGDGIGPEITKATTKFLNTPVLIYQFADAVIAGLDKLN